MPAVNAVGTPQPQPARLKLTGRATFRGELERGPDGQPVFSGALNLNGLRANQLKLSRSLAGRLEVSFPSAAASPEREREGAGGGCFCPLCLSLCDNFSVLLSVAPSVDCHSL